MKPRNLLKMKLKIFPNKFKIWKILVIFLLLVILPVGFLVKASTVPAIISYQGRLADADGNLLGGAGTDYNFKISFWTSPTVGAGSRVWPSSAPTAFVSTVRHGLFNLNIGDTTGGYPDALDYDFSSNDKIYLQVEVSSGGAYETLSPRQLMTSTPFASLAGAVSGSGASTMGSLTVTGNSTTTNATTTNLYANSSIGLNGLYVNNWSDLAPYLPTAAGWGTSSDSINFNSLLDAKDKGYFFASSSADVWGASKGYLTSYSETDPVWTSEKAGYLTTGTAASTYLTLSASTSLPYQPVGSYLITESDPIFMAASSSFLTLNNWFATTTWGGSSLSVGTNNTYGSLTAMGGTTFSTVPPYGTASIGHISHTSGWDGSGFLFSNSSVGSNAFSMVYNVDKAWFGGITDSSGVAWMTLDAGGLQSYGTVSGTNLSGTNTGDVTLANNLNGLTISNQVLTLGLASTNATGTLSATDWNTFNNKQPAGNYLTSYSETDPVWTSEKAGYLTTGAAASTYLTISASTSIRSLPNLSITKSQVSDFGSPLYSYSETDPLYASASSSILRFGTTSDVLTEGATNKFYTDTKVANYINSSSTLGFQNFTAGHGTTTNFYAGTSLGLNSQYISNWSELAAFLPTVTGWSTTSDSVNWQDNWNSVKGDYLTISSAGSTYLPLSASTSLAYVKTETDPVWTSEKSGYLTTGLAASTYLTLAASTSLAYQPIGNYLTSYSETDPVWTSEKASYLTTGAAASTYLTILASTSIRSLPNLSITKSQVSDFGSPLYSYSETDPVFTAWNKTTGITISESQITDLQDYLTTESDPVWTSEKASYLATSGNGGSLTGLTKTQVGLSNVDNYSSTTLEVLSATKLKTARTINGVSFDGTGNITVTDAGYTAASSSILRYGTTTDALTQGSVNKFYAQALVWNDIWASSTLATTLNNSATAYGWGNHADAGYLTTGAAASTYLTISASTSIRSLPNLSITKSQVSDFGLPLYSYTETDPVWNATKGNYLLLAGGTMTGDLTISNKNLTVTGTSTLATTTITNLSGNIITSNDVRTAITDLDTRLYNMQNTTKEMTGFPNRTDTSISFNNINRNFTITGTNFKIYSAGKEYVKNTESIQLANTNGVQFVYYSPVTLTLSTSTTVWNFNDGTVQIATVHWDGTTGLLGEERHGLTMDNATHEYLHHTVGTRYQSGLTGTFNTNNTLSVTAGSIDDEDIEDSVALTTTTRIIYHLNATNFTQSAVGTSFFDKTCTGSNLCYDNGTGKVAATGNNYVAYWIFATNDASNGVYVLMGQRQDTSLANAQANATYSSLTLGNLPFAEMKLLYRLIVRNNAGNTLDTSDYRSVSNLPSGTYVATAHNVLTGLDYASSGHTGFAGTGVDNTFTGHDIFASLFATNASSTNATTTNLQVVATSTVGGLSIGSLSGILKAVAGAVTTSLIDLANDVTGVLGGTHGGTGLSTVTNNELLIGSTGNTWLQIATSSLGMLTTNVAEGTRLYYTDVRARGAISSGALGLTYNSGTGAFSLTTDYNIPLTASTTNWNTAFNWGNHADGGYLKTSGGTMSGILTINNNLNSTGTSTLATTTMSYGSKIGYGNEYFTVNQYPVAGSILSGTIPIISFNSPNAWGSDVGGFADSLAILETGQADDPVGINFVASDFANNLNVGSLTYATTSNVFVLSNANGNNVDLSLGGGVFSGSVVSDVYKINGPANINSFLATDGAGQIIATTTPVLYGATTDSWNTAYSDRLKWDGGSSGLNASTARTSLGLVIGTNVQAQNAGLSDIAGLTLTDGNFIVGNGSNWVAESGATARTSIGLGSVENTALSTWAGSSYLTTAGNLTATGLQVNGNSTTTGFSTLATTTISRLDVGNTTLFYSTPMGSLMSQKITSAFAGLTGFVNTTGAGDWVMIMPPGDLWPGAPEVDASVGGVTGNFSLTSTAPDTLGMFYGNQWNGSYSGDLSGLLQGISNNYATKIESGATVSTLSGLSSFSSDVENQGAITGDFTNFLVNNVSGGGTLSGNFYGLKIGGAGEMGGTQNYSIYSDGGLNYFAGNVGIGVEVPTHPLEFAGGAYSDGLTWSNGSDRNIKENFVTLDSTEILNKINQLPIMQWNYKTQEATTTHIGPMAQDFYALFGVGGSDKSISTIDPSGIALVGIQALSEKTKTLEDNLKILLAMSGNWGIGASGELMLEKITTKKAEVQNDIQIGSPEKRIGITLFDEQTGEPYCLKISGGQTKTTNGKCSDADGDSVGSGGTSAGSNQAGNNSSSSGNTASSTDDQSNSSTTPEVVPENPTPETTPAPEVSSPQDGQTPPADSAPAS